MGQGQGRGQEKREAQAQVQADAASGENTQSTLSFSNDGLQCTVTGLTAGTEYDCRSQFSPTEPGTRPSFTTNATVDANGSLTWVVAQEADTRPGTYYTKLCAPGETTVLNGPDGNPLDWTIPNPNAA